jgi:sigma-B regulation protein RsbU (phosphoserine phosphatase)
MPDLTAGKLLKAKQLQIDSLLALTRAVNTNTKEIDLYELYELFLRNQMHVDQLILYYHREHWECVCLFGTDKIIPHQIVEQQFIYTNQLRNLEEQPLPETDSFNYLIPVFHKQRPLAFALVGRVVPDEYGTVDEKLNFIQTITNIIVSAVENKRLFKKQLTQQAYKKELDLARQMQNLLIPEKLPNNEKIKMHAVYLPHNEVGGDYYDCIDLNDEKISFCIADVSGKGVPAALLMSNFQATLRTLAKQNYTTERLIKALNSRICEVTRLESFVTLFYAKYNLVSKKLLYVNAGHIPPLLCNSKGVKHLSEGTTLIGMFEDLPHIKVGEIYLEEESTLLLYTDGLSDTVNEKDEYFGNAEIENFASLYYSMQPKEFNEKLMERLNAYKGNALPIDDISILTCKLF